MIENERDEEVNDGVIPQLPGGNLTILPLVDGTPDCAAKVVVDLTGLAAIAPEDPEPELVDINGLNQAVVTIQENNHIAIVDLLTGKVTANFTAGTVDLTGIDTEKDGVIALTGSVVRRRAGAGRGAVDRRGPLRHRQRRRLRGRQPRLHHLQG